jgi:hypothetical protein
MLPLHAPLARRSAESLSRSALPGAPVVPAREAPPAVVTRRVVATVLLSLADRVSPEPVERSRWQSG